MTMRFVALGDSFTEGLDDPYPGGGYRGWADLVAQRLAVETTEFAYANLAVRGRLIAQVVDEQVPAAVAMEPTLASFAAGTNDMLRPGFDPDQVGSMLRGAATALAARGARVVLFTGGDPSRRFPMGHRLLPRVHALNDHVRRVAADVDAALVDCWESREVWHDPRLWSVDRLHLNSEGHRRIALAVLEALGHDVEDWRQPLPALPPDPWSAARLEDLRWARAHLAPWVGRRLRRTSSGDGIAPKRPQLSAMAPD